MHRKNNEDVFIQVGTIEKDKVTLKTHSEAESSVGLCVLIGPETIFKTKIANNPTNNFVGLSSLKGKDEININLLNVEE